MNNKIFISGRISGIKYETAKKNFAMMEKLWRSRGYNPVNPLKLCKQEWSWLHCMIVCLWHLAQCRFVYFMSNYKYSIGSQIEFMFANLLNKIIYLSK